MAQLTDIRQALANSLQPLTGVQVSAYVLSNPTPPYAEVIPSETEYDATFQRGSDVWTLTVRVLVGTAQDRGAQARLDTFLSSSGPQSVKALVEADPTLGGEAEDLRVTRTTGYRLYGREGGAPLLGAEWTIECHARGDT